MAGFDVIVIGSGMGGLAAAALLARLHGRKVLVLERHYRAGGFTHTFARPGGFHWDVGVHYVGELDQPGLATDAMHLVTGGHVEWKRLPDPYDRLVFPDFEFPIRAGAEHFRADLKAAFPHEKQAIDAYLAAIRKASSYTAIMGMKKVAPAAIGALAGLVTRGRRDLALMKTSDWLDAHVKDERLRAVLGARWGDLGLPPGQSAMLMHSIIANHYLEGATYPVGSAARIAQGATAVLEAAGGQVRVRAEVEQILVEQGRAVGVRLVGGEELRAPVIISDAGARTTYGRLVPASVDLPFREELRAVPRSMANATLYLGLKAAPSTIGVQGENFWIHDALDHDRLAARCDEILTGKAPHVYVSFPSAKDPLATAHTAEIVVPVNAAPFAQWAGGRWRRRGEEYDALKQRLGDAMLELAERRIPGLRDLVVFREVSTPLSTEHFTGHAGGEIYGLPATPDRFRLPWLGPRTPVPGLYLTGADAMVLGVVGALMGGVFATVAIEGTRTFPKLVSEARRDRAGRAPARSAA